MATGQSEQLDAMYGTGRGDSVTRYVAGVDPASADQISSEVDRLLMQLGDENAPIPPELFLEPVQAVEEAPVADEIIEDEIIKEERQREEEELRQELQEETGEETIDETSDEALEEASDEVADEQTDESVAPAALTVAPGLADQISQVADNFETGRSQLAAESAKKPAPVDAAAKAEMKEAFKEVYEMLQCQ